MSAELPEFEALLARFALFGEAGVRRLTFEIDGELVSAFVRDGKLRALCTCGHEGCKHQRLAWSFLDPNGAVPTALPEVLDRGVRSSLRPPPFAHVDSALVDAFEDLLLATARSGVNAPASVSIRQALEQVVERAPKPPSFTLSRWVGRFNEALGAGEVGKLARLLDGARVWIDEQRAQSTAPAAVARNKSWLGSVEGQPAELLSDCALLEIAREWVNGISRSSIERRYLFDLHSGEICREERRRGEQEVSVGPCPRVLHVSFGELDLAVRPRRVRLLQYAVSPEPTQAHWRAVCGHADTRIAHLAKRHGEATRACPGLAEPFVIFAPKDLESGSQAALRDGDGERLSICDEADAPLADAIRSLSQGGQIAWVAGRVLGLARGLVMRPSSVLVLRDGKYALRRIT